MRSAIALCAVLLVVLLTAGCGAGAPASSAVPGGCGPVWTAAWHAAQQAVPGDQLAGRTLRMAVTPQVSGDRVRLRLSNRHGDGPLAIGAISVGAVAVLVGGRPDVRIEPGTEVLTDPVATAVVRGKPLTVSLFLTDVPARISSHPVAMRTAWLSEPGDHVRRPGLDGFGTTLRSWPVLDDLEVYAARPAGGLVVIGDSIVDGVGSTPDGDDRVTDQLAQRLTAERPMTVLNSGLSRNQLLQGDPPGGGDAPLTRFDDDVAGLPGVRDVLLLIGTNDLAAGADDVRILAGLRAFADRARASGLRVLVSTVPPSTNGRRADPVVVGRRDRLNVRIRTEAPGWSDGVVDAATALADPGDPRRLRPEYDSGDGLHPSATGYRALAAAVPVGTLSGSPCRTPSSG